MFKIILEVELVDVLVVIMLGTCFSVYSAVNYAFITLGILSLPFTSGFRVDPKTV